LLAELLGGLVKWQAVDLGPEVELIAASAASEAMEDATLHMHRESTFLVLAIRQRAAATKLTAATPMRFEVNQLQDLAHGDCGS
jgi:hypothetical protein